MVAIVKAGTKAVLLSAVLAAPALAQSPFDGIYRPVGETYVDWECTEESVGRDGGAMAVKDGVFFGVESACDLTSPVNVRDMDAMLFDAVCSAEGETYEHRLMLMKTKTGLVFVQNGFAFELKRCTPAAEAQSE